MDIISHSLIAFSIIFILVWLLRKSIFLPLVAWGIHIIIDIPTHSIELFPTPFLWPLSNFKFDGIAWDTPVVLITNAVLLLVLYGLWFMKYRQSKKGWEDLLTTPLGIHLLRVNAGESRYIKSAPQFESMVKTDLFSIFNPFQGC